MDSSQKAKLLAQLKAIDGDSPYRWLSTLTANIQKIWSENSNREKSANRLKCALQTPNVKRNMFSKEIQLNNDLQIPNTLNHATSPAALPFNSSSPKRYLTKMWLYSVLHFPPKKPLCMITRFNINFSFVKYQWKPCICNFRLMWSLIISADQRYQYQLNLEIRITVFVLNSTHFQSIFCLNIIYFIWAGMDLFISFF